MSAHSTLRISRDVARAACFRILFNMDDRQMEHLLDLTLDDSLYNVSISSEGEDDEHFQRVVS